MRVKDRNHLLNICAGLSVFALLGCNFLSSKGSFLDALSSSSSSPSSNTPSPSSPSGTTGSAGGGVGGITGSGVGLSGQGDLSVPTGKAAFLRISNGLEGNINIYQGGTSLSNAYPQLAPNMTNNTDPTSFSGAGANMLLSYAACVDVSNTHLSLYNINTQTTVSANQTALVNAGLRILDHQTAGLASGSSVTPQVTAALTAIVNQSVSNGVSPQIAFVTICTAASSAASTMLGF
jgi:hypothetical protein